MNGMSEARQVLVNLEINKDCQLTKICGDDCILNMIEGSLPDARQISSEMVIEVAQEVIDNGQNVRHLAITGKEPLDTPEVLFDILRRYRKASEETRPGRVGVITSGLKLRQCMADLVKWPLDWCEVSLDTSASGLHIEKTQQRLLDDLMALRQAGGTAMTQVASVFTGENMEALLELGRRVGEAGVDQWVLGTKLESHNGVLSPSVPTDVIKRFVNRVVGDLVDVKSAILYGLELDEWQILTGQRVADRWRVEHWVNDRVCLVAANFDEGYFVRLRWDGELINKQDFRRLGTEQGYFGTYVPGRLAEVLQTFAKVVKV